MLKIIKSWLVEICYILSEHKAFSRTALSPENLGFEFRQQSQEACQQKINGLMTLLRKTPWWAGGQLRLGWLALSIKEIELAFSSFQATLLLAKGKQRGLARVGLAKCFLARGGYQEALSSLQDLPEELYKTAFVKELIAACYVGQERYKEAWLVIEEIPETDRSAESVLVLEHLSRVMG